MPKLTIAIPTFNRVEQVVETVRLIIPQLNKECHLMVIDNASDRCVKDALEPLVGGRNDVLFFRNKFNIGLSGNICRCFELCQSEWLWIVGDTDEILPDGISKALMLLNSSGNDISLVCTPTEISPIMDDKKLNSASEFWASISTGRDFSNLLFIGSCLYKISFFNKQIRHAVHWASTFAPQIVLIIRVLSEGGVVRKSSIQITHWKPTPKNQSWSPTVLTLGLPLLLEVQGVDISASNALKKGVEYHAPTTLVALGLIAAFGPVHSPPLSLYFGRLALGVRLKKRIIFQILKYVALTAENFPYVWKGLKKILIPFLKLLGSNSLIQKIDNRNFQRNDSARS